MENKRRRRRRRRFIRRIKKVLILLFICFIGIKLIGLLIPEKNISFEATQMADGLVDDGKSIIPEWIDIQLIEEGNPSRRGYRLEEVRDIVIHYVGNAQTTAQQNHDYYCHEDSDVASHFVVGMEGEVIMCLPLDEWSSASNHRNKDTISIEVCHPDDTGKFTDETYASLVELTSWLMDEFSLDSEHVIRHYDVTGKICPKYYVEHEESWEQFKEEVKKAYTVRKENENNRL
jgi:N-acetylmuramoyl-L-alanine amidase CwlA